MPEHEQLSPALENYLESIYVLQKVKPVVKVNDIARYMKVKMPSVTYNMIRLASRGLVRYEKRSHVELTEAGECAARAVYRTHEQLFSFFHDVLGVGRPAAETDACTAEHFLSRETLDKLVQFNQWAAGLPDDRVFPPGRQAVAPPAAKMLSEVVAGVLARVTRITADGELRKRLSEMGLSKGAEVEVVRAAPLGDPIEIKVKGFHLSLRRSEASRIEVVPAVMAER
jgi:DtxR family Mn-dependent transcriptional regulator